MYTAKFLYTRSAHDFLLKKKSGMDLTRPQNRRVNLSVQQMHNSSSNWYYIFSLWLRLYAIAL